MFFNIKRIAFLVVMNIVVVGGGAAGVSAIQSIRKVDKISNLTLITDEDQLEYSRCGMPFYIADIVPKFESLVDYGLDWVKERNVNVALKSKVTKLDTQTKTVFYSDGIRENEMNYDKIIIATGSTPKIPPIEGIKDVEGIYTLRNYIDANKIKDIGKDSRVIILGAGLTGIELIEALHNKVAEITLVEALPHPLQMVFEPEITAPLVKKMEFICKKLYFNSKAKKVLKSGNSFSGLIIEYEGKDITIEGDVLIVSTGNSPNSVFAKEAGVNVLKTGHIIVNEKMETNIHDVYAAGDVTAMFAPWIKDYYPVGTGSVATRQGLVAGNNVIGKADSFTLPYSNARTTKCFGIEMAAVGAGSADLDRNGIKYFVHVQEGNSHPLYIPWNSKIIWKFFVSMEGTLLGVHCEGEGASQRINMFSIAIAKNMDINELRNIELSYAPAVSPVLDSAYIALSAVWIKWQRMKRII